MTDFNSTASVLLDQSHAFASSALSMLAPLSPYNPQPVFQSYWEAMCGRYSEYQIATYGSLLVQVVFYFGTAIPGFVFQFMAFMQHRKVQQNKQHTLTEQWNCLKQVLFSKSFIYVSRQRSQRDTRAVDAWTLVDAHRSHSVFFSPLASCVPLCFL